LRGTFASAKNLVIWGIFQGGHGGAKRIVLLIAKAGKP
jgi:hypothetical protein